MGRTSAARKREQENNAKKKNRRVSLRVANPRRRIGLLGALGLGGLVAILFLIVAFQAVIVGNQSHLDDLNHDLEDARKANQQLRFEVSELEAPERIRSVAIEQLGMVEPDQVTVLPPISASALEPSAKRWEPGSAAPGNDPQDDEVHNNDAHPPQQAQGVMEQFVDEVESSAEKAGDSE